jgi:uncharacterized protein
MKYSQNLFWIVSLTMTLTVGSSMVLRSLPAQAITLQDVPNPRTAGGAPSWVSDRANLISPQSEAQLNRMLTQLEAESGTEMAVVTVNETAPFASPKAFTTDLFNAWGVGKAAQDNGVLFLISAGDRRAEVVVGYGLESVLTQSKIEALLAEEAVPDFKQQNYDQGILDASEALVAELSASDSAMPGGIGKMVALGGGAIALLIAWFGRSWFGSAFGRVSAKKCPKCQVPLRKLSPSEVATHLSPAQKVSAEAGSATYKGQQCPTCEEVFLVRTKQDLYGYSDCPECKEPTVKSTRKTRTKATYNRRGEAEMTYTCQCCNHVEYNLIVLDQLSHQSDSSGSSGGGDFGGGSSGGDGGGASW